VKTPNRKDCIWNIITISWNHFTPEILGMLSSRGCPADHLHGNLESRLNVLRGSAKLTMDAGPEEHQANAGGRISPEHWHVGKSYTAGWDSEESR